MINGFRHEKRTESDRLCTIDQFSISGRMGAWEDSSMSGACFGVGDGDLLRWPSC